MPYLDTYTTPLTARTAAHLLRRATFGPTQQEISDFTGLTATEAVHRLISNVQLTSAPPPPVDLHEDQPTFGQSILNLPFKASRTTHFNVFIRCWWTGLMAEQNGKPSVLEKLAAFWQNHFVVAQGGVGDYRFSFRYLQLLRSQSLGNFRDLTIEITKDPAMLLYQNGNENSMVSPNENYGRELQELFTVGQKNFAGEPNYTEDDVKSASKVLTGWQATNIWAEGTIDFGSKFTPVRHDLSDKKFSSFYNHKVIQGRSGENGGDQELIELIDMLLDHPETAKFICRKLYRWYVNPNVTQDVENNVIAPLASFFSSQENNFAIQPILEQLLCSDVFFDESNVGAITKSPLEFLVGLSRFFNQRVPDISSDFLAFRNYTSFIIWGMGAMQLMLLDQPLVFGYPPYYQTGYSKNWINSATLTVRNSHVDAYVFPNYVIKEGYILGVDAVEWVVSLQENFSDVSGTPSISCEKIFEVFSENLFAVNLHQSQKDYLIDTVFMRNIPRASWIFEFNAFRQNPNDTNLRNNVKWRAVTLLRYMLRMAEFQLF